MVSAAFSGSASANTTTGEWPPSSMVVRFMPLAASAARCLPTGIEPVNEILRTASFARRCSDTSAGTPNTRLRTPAGKPASTKQRTISTQAPGVSSDALRMSAQPAASAPPILRAGVSTGKFHGVNAATMPTLAQHQLPRALHSARHDAAIAAAALLGVPVDDVGGGHHLGTGLDVDLALLLHHDFRDRIVALTHEIGGLAHDPGAV